MLQRIARLALAAALLVCGASAVGVAVKLADDSIERQAAFEAREVDDGDSDEAADERLLRPHPRRSVQTRIWLRPLGPRKWRVQVEHVIQLSKSDPLLAPVRSGDAALYSGWPQAIVGSMLIDDEDIGYRVPALQVDRETPEAVIRLEGAHNVEKDQPISAVRLSLKPARHQNTAQSVSMWASGPILAGVRGQEPTMQDAHSLAYTSQPQRAITAVWASEASEIDGDEVAHALAMDSDEAGLDTSRRYEWTEAAWEWTRQLLALAPAWLISLAYFRRSSGRLHVSLFTVTLPGLLTVPLVALLMTSVSEDSLVLTYLLLALLPLAAYAVGRRTNRKPLWTRRGLLLCAAVALASVVIDTWWLTAGWEQPPPVLLLTLLLGVGAVAIGASCVAAGRRSAAVAAGGSAVIVGAGAIGLSGVFTEVSIASTVPLAASVGVVWAGALSRPVRDMVGVSGRRWHLMVAMVGILALQPLSTASALQDPRMLSRGSDSWPLQYPGDAAAAALLIVLMAACLLALREMGVDPSATTDRTAKGVAVALVVAVITTGGIYVYADWWDVWRVLIAFGGLAWLLPHAERRTRRLARVTASVHRRVVGLELRRRLLQSSTNDLRRTARAELATGDLSVAAFDERHRALAADHGGWRPRDAEWIRIHEAAFGSGCGRTPWQNARFAALAGLALSLPYFLYEEVSHYGLISRESLFDRTTPLIAAVAMFIYLLRWAAYGLVFGYFLPLVRGRSPATKALALWIALAPIELVPLFGSSEKSVDLVVALLIRTGQLLVLAMGLALIWEVRIMRTAGFPWAWLRNIRNLRSLGAPVLAIVVAAATAATTVLAGSAVTSLLEQFQPPAQQQQGSRPPGSPSP